MKKLFALVLALALALVGITPAANNMAMSGTATIEAEVATLTETEKTATWRRGYALRCRRGKTKNAIPSALRRIGQIAATAALLPLLPLLGATTIGVTGARHAAEDVSRKARFLEEAKERAESGEGDEVLNAYEVEDAELDFKIAKERLRKIARGEGADPAAASAAKAYIHAAPWKKHEDAEPAPGVRTVRRCKKAKLWSYKLLDLGSLSAALSWFTNSQQHGIKAVLAALEDDNNDAAVAALNELETALDKRLASGRPFRVTSDKTTIRSGRQSLAAELFGVRPGRLTKEITTASYDMSALVSNKKLAKLIGLNHNVKEGIAHLKRIEQKFIFILEHNGVVLRDGDTETVYKLTAASNGMQKVGEGYFVESNKLDEVLTDLDAVFPGFKAGRTAGGAQVLKELAVLFTPSAPLQVPGSDEYYSLRNILMLPSVKRTATIGRAVLAGEDGIKPVKNHPWRRTEFDGSIHVLPSNDPSEQAIRAAIEPFQARGAGIKGVCANDGACAVYSGDLPDTVKDVDGVEREWRAYTFGCTIDSFKWGKLCPKWSDVLDGLDTLSGKYPTIRFLREVRRVNSAEEKERHASWQLLQQLLFATREELFALTAKGVKRLVRETRLSGALVRYAGLKKQDSDRSFVERIFELLPNIVAERHMNGDRRRRWEEDLAEQAAAPVMNMKDTQYPFIITDPVAWYAIVIGGANPETYKGLLKPGEINVPNTRTGKEVFFVRFPANMVTAEIDKQVNHPAYGDLGNFAIFAYGSETYERSDGDEDGDEGLASSNENLVNIFKKTLRRPAPTVLFEHLEAKDAKFLENREDVEWAVAEALTNANAYGSLVGRLSNAAKAWLSMAGHIVSKQYYNDRDRKIAMEKYQYCMQQATWCHIGTILAIDLTKTGEFPTWLEEILEKAMGDAGKTPWSQRFNRHDVKTPWYDQSWDGDAETPARTKRESLSPIDRTARVVLDATKGGKYRFDTEDVECDEQTIRLLLSREDGLVEQGVKGRIDPKLIRAIEVRNYKGTENAVIRAAKEGKAVSMKALLKFFWQNAAALNHTCRNQDEQDASANINGDQTAVDKREFYAFVRNVMLSMMDGEDTPWAKLTARQRRLSVVNKFVKDAFELGAGNGIGKDAANEVEREGLKGSYLRFVLNVFQEDILANVEENLDIPAVERWAHPVDDVSSLVLADALDLCYWFNADGMF